MAETPHGAFLDFLLDFAFLTTATVCTAAGLTGAVQGQMYKLEH